MKNMRILSLALLLSSCVALIANDGGLLGHGGILGTGVLERNDQPGEVVETQSGELYENDPGLLGGGGIAGTGVGKGRYNKVGYDANYYNEDQGEAMNTQAPVYRERRGVLGHGGVAGTGIGRKRLTPAE